MSAAAESNSTERPRIHLAALAELYVRDGAYNWKIPECPLCGGEHHHGGSSLDEDPRVHLRSRNAHCVPIKPEAGSVLAKAAELLNLSLDDYSLVDADPDYTAELIKSLEAHEDDVFEGIVLKEIGA